MAGLNPAAGALSDTRVDGSAHRNSPKPTQMARALDVLITDKPPVLGTRTLEEEKDARLAHLEQKRYDAAARNRAHQRERYLASKRKEALTEAMTRVTEALSLCRRLFALFQQPLPTLDALSEQSELERLDSKLMHPMATATVELSQMLPDMATQWIEATRTQTACTCDRRRAETEKTH